MCSSDLVNHQDEVLSIGTRDVANYALKPTEQGADRNHPRVHHALLDSVAKPTELMNRLKQLSNAVASIA